MFCSNCGKPVKDGVRFCTNCGAAIENDNENVVSEAPAAPVEPAAPVIPVAPIAPEEVVAPVVPEEVVAPVEEFAAPVAPAEPVAPEFPVAPVAPVIPEAPVVPVAPEVPVAPVAPAFEGYAAPVTPQAKPKSKKKIIIIISIILAVLVAAGGTWFAFSYFGKSNYNEEIESYLDFIVKQEDDAEKYIADAYMGGEFGALYSGEESDEIVKLYFELAFDEENSDMDYAYGSASKGGWESYTENQVKDFYSKMKKRYGNDWELKYEIVEEEELSNARVKRLDNQLEEIIDVYKELEERFEEYGSKSDREQLEDFIDMLEDQEINTAYEVEVEIEIDGKKKSFDDEFTFIVAEIGDEWVILEGPSFYEFLYAGDDD